MVMLLMLFTCRANIIPLVKCKTGNLSDFHNYRAIALSNYITNILEVYYIALSSLMVMLMIISSGSKSTILLHCVLVFF